MCSMETRVYHLDRDEGIRTPYWDYCHSIEDSVHPHRLCRMPWYLGERVKCRLGMTLGVDVIPEKNMGSMVMAHDVKCEV